MTRTLLVISKSDNKVLSEYCYEPHFNQIKQNLANDPTCYLVEGNFTFEDGKLYSFNSVSKSLVEIAPPEGAQIKRFK
jgi:hypothetical protein